MNYVLFWYERREGCNLWNDGCFRRCPICFTSAKFTATAASAARLGKRGSPQFLSSHFSPPSSLVSLEAVLLYFSRDVFKYNAVIVGLPIIPFLPVHPSRMTQQVEDLDFVVKTDGSVDADRVRCYKYELKESNGTSAVGRVPWHLSTVQS